MGIRQRLDASALPLGSACASALNFFSFILLPAHVGTSALELFARDNYLGGLYLAAIVSSVAPIGVFVLAFGSAAALRRYIALSILGLSVAAIGGWPVFGTLFSPLCLAGAVSMHIAGFLLTALVFQGRLWRAAALQVIQPLAFAVLLACNAQLFGVSGIRWSALYLLSTLVCVMGFALSTDWPTLRSLLRKKPTQVVGLRGMVLRMLLCVSFALFFQLELMICGEFTSIHLGDYTILQKLYSSVATSLIGSVGTLMLARQARNEQAQQVISRQSFVVALVCATAVMLIGGLVAVTGRNGPALQASVVAACAAVSVLFTLASFANLALQGLHPKISLVALLMALAVYGAIFMLWRPSTALQLLAMGGIFFGLFFFAALALSRATSD